jgi:uncharacterized membrane protein
MATKALGPMRLIYPAFIGAGAAMLIGAFITDLIYWNTLLFQWENFSVWLITLGLILAGISAVILMFDAIGGKGRPIDWVRFGLIAAAALLSLLNAFIHSRDAYTAVVPQGLILSAIVTILLIIVGVRGWSLAASRHASGARS